MLRKMQTSIQSSVAFLTRKKSATSTPTDKQAGTTRASQV